MNATAGELIRYTPRLDIRNLEALSRCKGARYLECVRGHDGALIAKHWRRAAPKRFAVLIDFAS